MTNPTMPLDGGGAELPVVTRAELGYDAPAAPAVEMRPLGSAPVGVDKAEADAGPPPASFAELYQFASGSEKLLLLFAVLCATGAGCSMPMMLIAFGSAFDQLGVAETLPGKSVIGEQMDKMLFTFVYIGVGMGLGKGLYIASVQYVCSSQMLKYKMAFLKAVLRQDVAWYDTSSPEELTTRFEEAMVKVQKGLSAPAFMFFEGLGYGLGSLVMAFVYEPVVAGITIAAVPLLIIPASLMMYLVEHGAKIVSSAYGKAGGIATEALFSMRTIVSLGLEERFEQRYSSSLAGARRATVKNMAAFGVSVGCALSAYLVMMVVAIIYGAFTLSQEMEKSEFDFIVPCREPWCGERTDNYYCAELGSNKLVSNQTWPCSAEDKVCLCVCVCVCVCVCMPVCMPVPVFLCFFGQVSSVQSLAPLHLPFPLRLRFPLPFHLPVPFPVPFPLSLNLPLPLPLPLPLSPAPCPSLCPSLLLSLSLSLSLYLIAPVALSGFKQPLCVRARARVRFGVRHASISQPIYIYIYISIYI